MADTQSAAQVVGSLEPAAVWQFFAGIADTPRPSKHEDRIRQHLRAVAAEHGLKVRQDPAGNLLIEAPASPGCEGAPIIVLQGHLDMVPVKNSDHEHNFETDPIRLIVEGDPGDGKQAVRANGTTLGADNGIGLAMALAAATEPNLVHGPLELLMTTDEEAGMTGAKDLSPDFFRGRRMLNLDSEEDEAIYIGCAGGMDTTLTWDFDTAPPPAGGETCRVAVSGLRGGHSGGDIHENRGNAIKLLARTMLAANPGTLRLAAINGGSLRNAIPSDASATIWGPAGTAKTLQQAARRIAEEAVAESYENRLKITVEVGGSDTTPATISAEETQRVLDALAALPHGVLGMHPKVAGLVQTSNNVATVNTATAGGQNSLRLEVGQLSRSSSKSLLHLAASQLAAVGRLAGAAVQHGGEYPGWEPNVDSPTLSTCRQVYERIFGEKPKVMAIHAGLECGIIGQRIGKMDMVSFGPTITGAHSPDERVFVASVQKSWKYLLAVLAELAGS